MLGATRNICVVANEFEQLNESTKTKCAEDRQVTSRQNMTTGGSFVDGATQIDGQRTTNPGRHPGIHKNNRQDQIRHLQSGPSNRKNGTKQFQITAFGSTSREKQKTNQQRLPPLRRAKTGHQTKLSCNLHTHEHEFTDGFLKHLADRILAHHQECARV